MPTEPAPFLRIEGASYGYASSGLMLDRLCWSIPKGEFHCLVGRSGCGKTTLLKMAAGLLHPFAGQVFIGAEAVAGPSAQAGFVFQAPTLLEWESVLDNILLPLSLRRRVRPQDREKAEALLDLVSLSGYGARHPRALSGGEQSRVAIARALVDDPQVLLLDEPFAALDAITREELQDDLLRLCALTGTTVLFVTHDIAEAIYLADRVAVMDDGALRHTLRVDLPRPRLRAMRYGRHFNDLCADLRLAMDTARGLGGDPGAVVAAAGGARP